jgi:hypothetical protein
MVHRTEAQPGKKKLPLLALKERLIAALCTEITLASSWGIRESTLKLIN